MAFCNTACRAVFQRIRYYGWAVTELPTEVPVRAGLPPARAFRGARRCAAGTQVHCEAKTNGEKQGDNLSLPGLLNR